MRYILAAAVLLCIYLVWRIKFFTRAFQLAHTLPDQTGEFWVGSKDKPPFEFLILGDSIAAGTGIDKFEKSVGGRLAAEIGKHHYVHLVNKAQAGAWVTDIAIDNIKGHWDLILIIGGSNELIHRMTPRAFRRSLIKLFNHVRPHSQNIAIAGPGDVGHAKVLPFLVRWPLSFRQRDFVRIMSEQAYKHSVLYINPLEHPNKEAYFAADHLHPNALGHEIWFDIIWLRLGPQLERGHLAPIEPAVTINKYPLLNELLIWLHTLMLLAILLSGLFVSFWWVVLLVFLHSLHLYLFDGCSITRFQIAEGGIPYGYSYFQYCAKRFFHRQLSKTGAHYISLILAVSTLTIAILASLSHTRL